VDKGITTFVYRDFFLDRTSLAVAVGLEGESAWSPAFGPSP
jgi:hypothetical protein